MSAQLSDGWPTKQPSGAWPQAPERTVVWNPNSPAAFPQTFSLFACRSVCDDKRTFLRADLDVSCWEGIHSYYAFDLGLPMLFLYVIGLPVAALLRVRSMHQTTVSI